MTTRPSLTGCGKTGACVQHRGRAALQGRESRSESVTALQAAEKPRICVLSVLCGLQCLAYQGTAFNHTVLPRNENRLFSRCGNDLSRRPVFPQPVSVVPIGSFILSFRACFQPVRALP